MTAPRVAVVIPCFNHGAYLPEALASVAAQTLADYEVIVVDDGSDDPETGHVLAAVQARGISVVRTEHRGLSAARNAGARRTTAPYLCMLDADDRLAPEWLAKAVAVLDSRPEVAFVSHWLRAFGEEEWEWRPERCDFPALLARNTVNGAALVRRLVWEAVGGFDERFREGCEDWDFWISAVERGYQGVIIPEVLFHYRRRSDSMSRRMVDSGRQRDALGALIDKHEATFRAHLEEVIVEHERELAALQRAVWDLEAEYADGLGLERQRAAERLARARRRASRLEEDLRRERESAALKRRVDVLSAEISALRGSWSWRLTAPLRAMYSRLRGEGR